MTEGSKAQSPAGATPLDEQGLPRGYPWRAEYEVTPRQVRDALRDRPKQVVLIDVRREDEWRVARIEGAVLIPLSEIERRAEEIMELAEDAMGGEGSGGGVLVAVHCHHGVRSLKATLALRAKGINAFSVAGGIELWSLDIDPRVPRY
jgi:adenylyltransferase/sulfurtransferase